MWEHPVPLSKESRAGIGGAKHSGAGDEKGRRWGSLGFRHGPIFLMAHAARDVGGMLPCTRRLLPCPMARQGWSHQLFRARRSGSVSRSLQWDGWSITGLVGTRLCGFASPLGLVRRAFSPAQHIWLFACYWGSFFIHLLCLSSLQRGRARASPKTFIILK